MRIYDPRLGKFLSVDPLTASYPELTPYQFASNMPINSIDLDGLESKVAIYKQKGTEVKIGYLAHADNVMFDAGARELVQTHKLPSNGILNFYIFENRVESSYTYLNEDKKIQTVFFGPQETQDGLAEGTVKEKDFEAGAQFWMDGMNGGVKVNKTPTRINPRNPFGRKGGPLHQNEIGKIEDEIRARGNTPRREYKVETPGQNKNTRHIDVAEFDADGNLVKYHQVGKQNKDGTPVSREKKAIEDVQNSGDNTPVEFHPYNKPQ